MKIALPIIVFSIGVGATLLYTNNKYKVYEEEEPKQTKKHVDTISMMLETEAGSGNYEMTTASSWPTEGYVFNTELSKCENGGELSWDDTNKRVVMSGNVSDKCYVYFDVYVSPRFDEICDETTLACYVAKLYTGTQGENSIYYHNSSLTNGAGDNSYRYAGANPNNYVCFGSTASPCPADNLYRIIGVFGDKVKLIKYDYANSNLLGTDGDYTEDTYSKSSDSTYKGELTTINTYYWNYKNDTSINSGNGSNEWSTSLFNKVNLNTNFLNNIGTTWSNLIEDTTWKVSGHADFVVTPSTMYTAEITNATKTYGPSDGTSKIGLMYASDYGFAASPSAWTTVLFNYDSSSITSVNWMYMGLTEWTITPYSSYSNYVFPLGYKGNLYTSRANFGNGARPVLYLKSSASYAGGSGTKDSPITLAV